MIGALYTTDRPWSASTVPGSMRAIPVKADSALLYVGHDGCDHVLLVDGVLTYWNDFCFGKLDLVRASY